MRDKEGGGGGEIIIERMKDTESKRNLVNGKQLESYF